MKGSLQLLAGDCRAMLATLEPDSVHCVVTSPPYFGLRDYGVDGQMGLEASPDEFIAGMVAVFRECRRVLRDDGTLWLNVGDSYAGSGRGGNPEAGTKQGTNAGSQSVGVLYGRDQDGAEKERARIRDGNARLKRDGIKPKDLIGIPWMLAFALRADGWYLRQDIIWSKPNPMPESVTDRCTKAHEYLFLMSKSPRYYFNAEAIAEPLAESSIERLAQNIESQAVSNRVPGKSNGVMKAVGPRFGGSKHGDDCSAESRTKSGEEWTGSESGKRNKRSVWTIATQPFKEAHFATFPPALVEPCVLAGCPFGGVVLDPFAGAGTAGLVADRLQRDAVLIELSPAYAEIARKRIAGDSPLFADVA